MSHYVLVHGQDYCLAGASDVKTLPQLLPDDFQSHLIGKYHLGHSRQSCLPTSLGYDSFSGYYLGSIDFFSHNNTEVCSDDEVCSPARKLSSFPEQQSFSDLHNLSATPATEYITDSIVEKTLNTISDFSKTSNQADRLFLHVNMAATHAGPLGPAQYKESDVDAAQFQRSSARAGFAAMTKNLDEGIARIFDSLHHAGILEDSMVVVMSDNGGEPSAGASNWPLRGEKFTYFQGGINTPAFVKLPGGKAGTIDDLMWVGDVAPTILEAAGAKAAAADGMDGRSRLGEIMGASRKEKDAPFVSGVDPVTYSGAVFYKQFKLVVNATSGYDIAFDKASLRGWSSPGDSDNNVTIAGEVEEVMLFDLARDPSERVNLASSEQQVADLCLREFRRALAEAAGLERQTKARGLPLEQVTPGSAGILGPFIDEEVTKKE
jgi:arylsulfatase A-like enzyme